ncbi:MAG: hypothetical protein ACE5J6_02685 [Candidatus Bathyarchaeia archaeon]
MRIVISKFGKVGDEEIERVIEVMEECYNRLAPHDVTIVDLYVFERSSSVDAFLAKESAEVGVVSAPFDELFFAMHDAWRGMSRIILCLERMKRLPRLVRMGGIRHEVGHSVLHGSLRYYFLSFPPPLLKLADQFNLSFEYLANLLYLISIAVKDYEVSHLLYRRGYVKDQVAYTKHLLKVSESDVLSWEVSRSRPPAEALYLISCLKTAGCAVPLLVDNKFGEEMRRHLMESLSHLPADRSSLLLRLTLEWFPSLGTDTLDNIEQMVRGCKLIFETVF